MRKKAADFLLIGAINCDIIAIKCFPLDEVVANTNFRSSPKSITPEGAISYSKGGELV